MSFYYYGYRAIIVSAISAAISLLTEYICCTVTGKRFSIRDTSPIMSALLLALMMPASVPYRIIVFSSIFMIAVCKYAFGGNKNLIFSPAALAYAFAVLSWPNNVLRYPEPVPFGHVSLESDVQELLDYSFTHYADISISSSSYLDIIWGRLAGPMGTTCILVIAICAVSLYLFRDIPGTVLFSAIAANVLLFVLFPLAATGWTAAVYALVTGSFLFVLVFMTCDYRFVPKRPVAQVFYGVLFALISFLLRKLSGIETAAVFSLLIVSVFSSELDRLDIVLQAGVSRFWLFCGQKFKKLVLYIRFKRGLAASGEEAVSENSGEAYAKEGISQINGLPPEDGGQASDENDGDKPEDNQD